MDLLDVSLEVLGHILVIVDLLQLQEILELQAIRHLMLEQVGYLLDLLETLIWEVQDQLLKHFLQMSIEISSRRRLCTLQQVLQVVVLLHVSATSYIRS